MVRSDPDSISAAELSQMQCDITLDAAQQHDVMFKFMLLQQEPLAAAQELCERFWVKADTRDLIPDAMQ